MNKRNKSSIIILMVIGVIVGGTLSTNIAIAAPQRPSDENLMAFKVYHHAVYMGDDGKTGWRNKQAASYNRVTHRRSRSCRYTRVGPYLL